ncbi:bifunctional serine/threonine-protein kinase/ABC transporter substrate-binding protein [Tychonema sp. BBK16]|uniref:bifunctional serine/threonine-protein kinase/ABC transporter substrate-binding protein n=1 Tax=Tychonema sp. BBK16 TaxID=2699888 RepID=UPI001F430CE5|nr:bifunctional serine/threonine-protein kinase/ABC transporter substrate-binding protein [Tychonema sp. BBK16]MCF6375245.1 bifunctional serine/threonine-protein kinase/ABC transporter substrate-binding protein [Tychonema sp. BBK16]
MCLKSGDILRHHYEIIAELGRGGSAITYRAFDRNNPENSLCVVKEILPPRSNQSRILQEAQAQFEKEVSSLEHLHNCGRIPKLIDRFQENGNFYLIQEYIEGHPLNQEIFHGNKFTEPEVINLLSDILSVLAIIHEQRIIHRDIKPSNLIRRQSDNKIVLIDFGSVKGIRNLAIEHGQITQTRAIGTEGYMPAEQCKNQPKCNSDIYAAGIIGIQALTGLRVEDFFHDKETCELIWHYATPDRPIIQISDELARIFNKMVRYHFDNRYQSAAEVLQDLRSLAKNAINDPPSPPNPPLALEDGLSAGETILFTSSNPRLKQRGVHEFATSKSDQALNLFKESWQKECKDPETLVYMNNAFLETSKTPYYTISVVLPIDRKNPDPDSSAHLSTQAKEFLCGVAQAQTEVNLGMSNFSDRDFPGQAFLPSKSINGKGLKLIIADDANDGEEAKQRAILLVNQPEILAVIGHANSEMTMHAVDIYNENNLVLMSPGAATEELTYEPKEFFFRTQYTSSLIAKDLADHLLANNQKKAALLYNQASPFCASFIEDYTKYFRDCQGGEIVWIRDFDISKKNFNAQRAMKEIQANGETAIVLVPDAHVRSSLDNAFEIIKLNGDSLGDCCAARNWIVGAWTLMMMGPEILELVSQQQQNLFKKLIFSVGWHHLSSPNQEFAQQARLLWGQEGNTRVASAYDAARALIKALEMQPKPSRRGIQKMLSSPDFSAYGATGIIQFNSPHNGNRKNPPSELVHIVECPKEQFGAAFVPVNYSTATVAG